MSGPGLPTLVEQAHASGSPICLDTSAVLAFLLDEPAAPHVAALINDPALTIVISTITLAEVGVRPAEGGRAGALAIIGQVVSLPALTVHAVDEVISLETALVRARTRLRLPDAIVVATARVARAAALVGNDRQWGARDLGLPFVMLDDLL